MLSVLALFSGCKKDKDDESDEYQDVVLLSDFNDTYWRCTYSFTDEFGVEATNTEVDKTILFYGGLVSDLDGWTADYSLEDNNRFVMHYRISCNTVVYKITRYVKKKSMRWELEGESFTRIFDLEYTEPNI